MDVYGHCVREISEDYALVGQHQVSWNGRDEAGHPLNAGVYYIRLTSGTHAETKGLPFSER